ncbi:Protein of unknown function [Pyronema omphalodes CBS 100304]|uniref:Uncharacterized protein n=1 Tax=Pyronema omphalodes (strain CBS 100304) TaxID=1076935 RepID=U4L4E2_PYROM|nr:Protein of unknown function [Pyronema omphalodes CBS 100304]
MSYNRYQLRSSKAPGNSVSHTGLIPRSDPGWADLHRQYTESNNQYYEQQDYGIHHSDTTVREEQWRDPGWQYGQANNQYYEQQDYRESFKDDYALSQDAEIQHSDPRVREQQWKDLGWQYRNSHNSGGNCSKSSGNGNNSGARRYPWEKT